MERLSDFIAANREPILAEWEAFARSVSLASGDLEISALREHADAMLSVIAADLNTPQGMKAQSEKSKGNAPVYSNDPATPAAEHGAERADRGFTLEQMIAEYRALRASVIRLWMTERLGVERMVIDDMTRFHEAIDQSLAESVVRFTKRSGEK